MEEETEKVRFGFGKFKVTASGAVAVLMIAIVATTALIYVELKEQNRLIITSLGAHSLELTNAQAIASQDHKDILKEMRDNQHVLRDLLLLLCVTNRECKSEAFRTSIKGVQ